MVENSPSDSKLPLLNLLRWLASLFVIFWHYQHFLISNSENLGTLSKTNFPFYDNFQFIYDNTINPVGVFWVLSGLLISKSYTSMNKSKSRFIKSRIIRLYPLALVSLGFTTILQMISHTVNGEFLVYKNNTLKNFLLNLLLINGGTSFNGPIYSLTLEIPFYLIYSFFYLRQSNYLKIIGQTFLLLTIFSVTFLIAINQDLNIHMELLLLCGIHFHLGVLLHLLAKKFSILVLTIFFCSALITGFSWNIQTFLSVGVVGIFLSSDLFAKKRKWIQRRNLKYFGDISYMNFLFHIPVQLTFMIAVNAYSMSQELFKTEWFFIIYIICVQLISLTMHKYIQRPVTSNLQKRFL